MCAASGDSGSDPAFSSSSSSFTHASHPPPITTPSVRHPLDQIVGTVAAVRVLRELCRGGEFAPPHLAATTGTSRPAVREALIRLEGEEIVERVGQGRNVLYRLVDDHPLARRLVKLFRSEGKEFKGREK